MPKNNLWFHLDNSTCCGGYHSVLFQGYRYFAWKLRFDSHRRVGSCRQPKPLWAAFSGRLWYQKPAQRLRVDDFWSWSSGCTRGRFGVRLLRDDVLLKDNERFRERDSFKYSFCSDRRIAQCDYRWTEENDSVHRAPDSFGFSDVFGINSIV